jgi:hypothetical protein
LRIARTAPFIAALLAATGMTATPAHAATPAVTFSPAALTFAAEAVGATSAAQSITITNTGTANLFINSAATRGADPLDFTEVDDGCSGLTLPAGGSCAVAIDFSPTATGTRTATFILTDNAPGSPQSVPISGTATGTNPPLSLDTQFFTCTGGVCDIGAGGNVFVGNFFTTTFAASGGTAPYTWTGQVPAGLSLHASGLLLGAPTAVGTTTFPVTVTDATGAGATGLFSLTVTGPPASSPPGCQTGGLLSEPLSGSALGGQTPRGTARSDETHFSGCGGFSVLTLQVSHIGLPDGSQLWATLDFKPVGVITLKGGSGSLAPYNLGDFGVSRDQIRVYSSLPDAGSFQQILIGGAFS